MLERGGVAVAGVEVKAGASVNVADLRGAAEAAVSAGRQFASGVVLYDGGSVVRFDENLFAVPLRTLWED